MTVLKISKFTRICMENYSYATVFAKVVFLIQVLLTFGGRSGFLILICFIQLVLTKFFKSELFSFLAKVDHVITVMQMAYSLC